MPASIVCPFCSLHCDDVSAGADEFVEVDCQLARRGFRNAVSMDPPRLGDRVFADEAVFEFDQMGLSNCPIVEVGWLSIEEAKCLQALSDRVAIKLMHPKSAVAETIARDGAITTTVGEVIARSDLVWMIGKFDGVAPRLAARLHEKAQLREGAVAIHSSDSISIKSLTTMHRASLSVDGVSADGVAVGDPWPSLIRSRSLAVVVGEDAFVEQEQWLAFEMLNRLVANLNTELSDGRSRRAAILHLDPHQNLLSVFRWRTNHSPSDSSIPGIANHWRPDIRLGEAGKGALPVRLQIGGADPGEAMAAAYLPAAMPGVHCRGTSIRGDGSVTLPLLASHESFLDDRVTTLRRVLDSVG